MIAFSCSQCGMKLKVKTQFAGRSSKCPSCKQPLLVPEPGETQAYVPPEQIDGAESSLAKAGLGGGGVTLDQPGPKKPGGKRPIGEVLAGRKKGSERYVIEGEIARGGMGAVLRAIDGDIRREVAVKYMLDEKDPKKKARFIEEAQINGQLEHPNIVPVYDLGIDGKGRPFIMMKMVKGRSLKEALDQLRHDPKQADKDFSLARLLNVLVSVCNALAFAHSRGVVHRDLKPANIMLGDFGEVYVMDWGLAKVRGQESGVRGHESAIRNPQSAIPAKVATSRQDEADLTQEGAILGTPVYMPPEQANGQLQAIDQRSDVYSLGAILYEMLTLQPPVEKEGGYLAILMRVIQGEIVPPDERVRRDVEKASNLPAIRAGFKSVPQLRAPPRELSAIAMKALSKNREQRYPSVEAFRRDLELYQEGRSVSAKQDTTKEMIWKFVKRNKALSAAAAVVALVLVWSSWFNFQARREAEDANARTTARTEQAVPALVEAARLAVERRNYRNALEQVDLALTYAPDHVEARLLKGQLLIVQQDFTGARAELERYLRQQPTDADAKSLLQLCRSPQPNDEATSLAFARVFNQQQAYGLIDGALARYGKTSVEARNFLLEKYRKQIEAAWPGRGNHLEITTNGLRLDFFGLPEVRDLSPLRGMPLTWLRLEQCHQVQDLAPLQGMPLTHLNVGGCRLVGGLTPLRGMPLTDLVFYDTSVRDLTPLKDMRLRALYVGGPVQDLTPLRGMPLETLSLQQCGHVSDLACLKGLPLKLLFIASCERISDLTPLEDMRLEGISLTPRNITRGMQVLRRMKSLKTISTDWFTASMRFSAAEFWAKYDAGEFK